MSYVEEYLDAAAANRWTPATFFSYRLRGLAKQYAGRYQAALLRALTHRVEAGEVVAVPSRGGSVAYVRVTDL